MGKLTYEERENKVKQLLKKIKQFNEITRIGFEYFILRAIDDELELEILDNTITALIIMED